MRMLSKTRSLVVVFTLRKSIFGSFMKYSVFPLDKKEKDELSIIDRLMPSFMKGIEIGEVKTVLTVILLVIQIFLLLFT